MGVSSSGSAAFTMAWSHPEFYHRVLTYSPTVVNQQWQHNPALPGGAWEYHSAWAGSPGADLSVEGGKVAKSDTHFGSPLIPNSPTKPIRIWFETGDHDLFYPVTPVADGMHYWTLADERFAKVLADKGITTSSCLPAMRSISTRRRWRKRCPLRSSGYGRGYPAQ